MQASEVVWKAIRVAQKEPVDGHDGHAGRRSEQPRSPLREKVNCQRLGFKIAEAGVFSHSQGPIGPRGADAYLCVGRV